MSQSKHQEASSSRTQSSLRVHSDLWSLDGARGAPGRRRGRRERVSSSDVLEIVAHHRPSGNATRATTLKPARRNVRQQTLGVALLSLALLTAARRRVLAPYVAHPLRQQLDALASTAGTRFRGGGLCTM